MKPSEIIKKLRIAIADSSEPYIYADKDLKSVLESAAGVYSKYRPARRKGVIEVAPRINEYMLPDDLQTWISGFEGYAVYEKTLDLGFEPTQGYKIEFFYLADRKPEEVPVAHIPLLIDYCFYFVVDGAIKETSDISALRLGKGLQIQFDNIKELSKAAERRLNNFNEKLLTCLGGWA